MLDNFFERGRQEGWQPRFFFLWQGAAFSGGGSLGEKRPFHRSLRLDSPSLDSFNPKIHFLASNVSRKINIAPSIPFLPFVFITSETLVFKIYISIEKYQSNFTILKLIKNVSIYLIEFDWISKNSAVNGYGYQRGSISFNSNTRPSLYSPYLTPPSRENRSFSHYAMQIEECNFNFTYIKIRHSSALPSLGSRRRKGWGDKKRWIASRGGGGLERSVGISRKAISILVGGCSVGKRCPSSSPALTLLEAPLPWLVSRARGKPGENQSPKLEYKPISGGVRGLRTPCAREETRRGEARDEILKEAALSNRESNLHTLHKRDTNWRGERGEGRGKG